MFSPRKGGKRFAVILLAAEKQKEVTELVPTQRLTQDQDILMLIPEHRHGPHKNNTQHLSQHSSPYMS
jgi:hypothetical protein